MNNKNNKKLNALLESYPANELVLIPVEEVELMKRLEHDGLVSVIKEEKNGEYITQITPAGIAFRLNGGYKLPQKKYELILAVCAVISVLVAIVSVIFKI